MTSRAGDSSAHDPQQFGGEDLAGMRPYMLAVAAANLPRELWPKVAPSDVVQDALYEASRTGGQFRGRRTAQLKAWLRSIVVNKVIDVQRRFRGTRKRSLRQELPYEALLPEHLAASGTSPSGRAANRESRQRLIEALATLPDDRRRVIVLREFDGLQFAEIAQQMGRSVPAVRSLWWRAIESLRQELESPHER